MWLVGAKKIKPALNVISSQSISATVISVSTSIVVPTPPDDSKAEDKPETSDILKYELSVF